MIVRIEDIERALAGSKDGNAFERFAQDLLISKLGDEFIPVGGSGDRGRDGLERVSCRKSKPRHVYQISIEVSPKAKIAKTIASLRSNDVDFDRLTYISPLPIHDAADLEEYFEEQDDVTVRIRNSRWLAAEINRNSQATRIFLSHYGGSASLAEGNVERAVARHVDDPRIFVFLQQQLDHAEPAMRLDNVVLDGLIIYVLEGTDPDEDKFLTEVEIIAGLTELAAYLPKRLTHKVGLRLKALSQKPRRIRYHKGKGYCLPFETRAELLTQNAADNALLVEFQCSAGHRMDSALSEHKLQLDDSHLLVSDLCGRIFKEQGLQFAAFLKGEDSKYEQPNLSAWAHEVAGEHVSGPKTITMVADALTRTVRDIVYNGAPVEAEYLRKLAETFVVLFTLQCDPAVATFFADVASGLTVWVDNSILVPAMSEIGLPERHRRFQNLLRIAADAGVSLLVDSPTVRELLTHIERTYSTYVDVYRGREALYNNEAAIASVDEILIRSYLYSRLSNPSQTFELFVDKVLTLGDKGADGELIEWLKGRGVQFRERILEDLPAGKLSKLSGAIKGSKSHSVKADNDARTLLSVAETRIRANERGGGIFGFSTWWLTQDVVSGRALELTFPGEYPGSPCLRPDFLYNYICLSPKRSEVEHTFDRIFPSLLGVTISHHLDPSVTKIIKSLLKQFDGEDKSRLGARLQKAVNALMSDEKRRSPEELRTYLEDALSQDT